jgi:hypothetical protein
LSSTWKTTVRLVCEWAVPVLSSRAHVTPPPCTLLRLFLGSSLENTYVIGQQPRKHLRHRAAVQIGVCSWSGSCGHRIVQLVQS